MIIKKACIMCLVLTLLFSVVIASAEIIEDHKNPDLSVLDYIDISTSISEDGFLTKEVRLKIENINENPLFNLKMNMRLVPDNLTIVKGDLYFETVFPGDIALSVNTAEYIVNTNNLENGEVPIIWSVEFEDINEKVWKNESIIIEKINY